MQESEIARSRKRSQKTENRRQVKNAKTMNMRNENVKNEMLNKKEQAFQDFTTEESSQIERVEMKMTTIHDEMMNSKTAFAVHRVDLVSERNETAKRESENESESESDHEIENDEIENESKR
jgi:hypothetical protein